MSIRLLLLVVVSVLMLIVCIGLEVSGSNAPRPGFVGVCGVALMLTALELHALGQRLGRLEDRLRDLDEIRLGS